MNLEEKITPETIAILQSEGLGEAVNELGNLLRDPDGLKKHGQRGWLSLSNRELLDKVERHTPKLWEFYQADPDSKRSMFAHLASRALMGLARTVKYCQP